MTNDLIKANNTFTITIWDDDKKLLEIKNLFAPDLTQIEFQMFVGLGKSLRLDPFKREIWAVKYDPKKAAQIFVGRDGYRKVAQAQPEYDYHQCDAVYENDMFEVVNAELKHSYSLKNRGRLMGAYCIAKRKHSSRPIYVYVEFSEYNTGQALWRSKPATMIKKVAECQCLRACFQEMFGGTYGEEEMPESIDVTPYATQKDNVLKFKEILSAPVEDQKKPENQTQKLLTVFKGVGVTLEDIEKFLGNSIEEIEDSQLEILRTIYASIKKDGEDPQTFFKKETFVSTE